MARWFTFKKYPIFIQKTPDKRWSFFCVLMFKLHQHLADLELTERNIFFDISFTRMCKRLFSNENGNIRKNCHFLVPKTLKLTKNNFTKTSMYVVANRFRSIGFTSNYFFLMVSVVFNSFLVFQTKQKLRVSLLFKFKFNA